MPDLLVYLLLLLFRFPGGVARGLVLLSFDQSLLGRGFAFATAQEVSVWILPHRCVPWSSGSRRVASWWLQV